MRLRVLKRLRAAVGYSELGMTQQALRCLDIIESFGNIAPFGIVVDILRCEFVKNVENDVSAANALRVVASMLSTSERRAIRMTLAVCYGKIDVNRESESSDAKDRNATPEAPTNFDL
jgi:hypothetical protein